MADEWIRMRAELFTHPRFLYLVRELIYGDDHGLMLYVCGPGALQADAFPPCNERVTDRSLHDVTLCALMRVWCSVNAHCKVDGSDAICIGMDTLDIDTLAGFSGFGNALARAGWVRRDDDRNCLVFPNFLEFNEPACLRRRPKTVRERVAECRARQRASNGKDVSRNGPVTNVTKCNAREEKRREEDKNPPNPPQGGGTKAERRRAANEEPPPDFVTFWSAYPRKVDKQDALKSWRRLAPDAALVTTILAALERYKASDQWQRNNGQYIPHPTTWLNKRRWESAIEPDNTANIKPVQPPLFADQTRAADAARETIPRAEAAKIIREKLKEGPP